MKNKPSESTERLIESLYVKKALWDRFVQIDPQDEIIRQIADAGEPAAIPDLLPFLIIADKRSILASAKPIHHLLQILKPTDFVRFDEFVRQGYPDWRVRREPWYLMKPKDVGHLASMGEMSVSLFLGLRAAIRTAMSARQQFRSLEKRKLEPSFLSF
jgi:hypothetical protein